jgi:hypothetical protein
MSIKYFLFWLPMIVIAFANATLRQVVLIRSMSDLTAHQVSTITLMVLCSIYVWFIFPLLGIQNFKQAFLIGSIWVVLTVLFEFSLGRLTNKSWAYLLKDYNITEGHIWLLFLLCLFLLPCLYYMIRK